MKMKQQISTVRASTTSPPPQNNAKIYEDLALRGLRNAGYRITMPRVQVIRALADTDTALSAYAIHDKITSTGGKIDVVSVYRILSTLQEVGLIHHIGVVDGYFPCRLSTGYDRRTEVIIEENTGAIRELVMPFGVIKEIEEQVSGAGFNVVSIKVEIVGRALIER